MAKNQNLKFKYMYHFNLIDFSNFLALCSSSTDYLAFLYTAASKSSFISSLAEKIAPSFDRYDSGPYEVMYLSAPT